MTSVVVVSGGISGGSSAISALDPGGRRWCRKMVGRHADPGSSIPSLPDFLTRRPEHLSEPPTAMLIFDPIRSPSWITSHPDFEPLSEPSAAMLIFDPIRSSSRIRSHPDFPEPSARTLQEMSDPAKPLYPDQIRPDSVTVRLSDFCDSSMLRGSYINVYVVTMYCRYIY